MPGSAGTAIRAGRAFVELFADDRRLVRGLRKAQARLRAFGAGVRAMGTRLLGAGAAIAAPLLAATKIFTSAGDQIHKLSIKTGVSAEALSQLKFAAEQSGTSLEVVGKAIGKMQKGFLDTERNLPLVNDLLTELRLDLDALKGKSPEEQFLVLADALAAIEDPSRQAGLAMTVFGKAGADLIPLMKGGRASIQELMKEADSLGLTITGPMAESAAESADAWNRVKQTLRGVAIQIGGALAPTITDLGNRIAKITTKVIDWVKENGDLVRTVFKVAVGVMAVGAGLVAAGVLISSFGAILGAVASTIGLVTGAIGLLLSPIGLLVAAIGGAIAIAATFSAGFRKFLGGAAAFIGEAFTKMKETVGNAFKGVKNALAVGDFETAWKIATLGMQIAFFEFADAILAKWGDFIEPFVQMMQKAWKSVRKIWISGITEITSALLKADQEFGIFGPSKEETDANENDRIARARIDKAKIPGLKAAIVQQSDALAGAISKIGKAGLAEAIAAEAAGDATSGEFQGDLDRANALFGSVQTGAGGFDFSQFGLTDRQIFDLRKMAAEIEGNRNLVNSFEGLSLEFRDIWAEANARMREAADEQIDEIDKEPLFDVAEVRKRLADLIEAQTKALDEAKAKVEPDPKVVEAIENVEAAAGPVAQERIAKVASGTDVSGTFSAEAARGLGPNTVQTAQLDQQKKMAGHLDQIENEIKKADQLVFAK